MGRASDLLRSAPRRDPEAAAARSAAYALFSRLVASPFDVDDPLPPADLPEVLAELEDALPFEIDFSGLADAVRVWEGRGVRAMERAYSSLFEVGSDGPPIAVREELAAGRPAGSKEEMVRFYAYFGYELSEDQRWAPDHLSIELEFLHFLAFKESRAGDGEEALSYRLGQVDFLERHPHAWLPHVLEKAERHGAKPLAAEPWYHELFHSLETFLRADLSWQKTTAGRRP